MSPKYKLRACIALCCMLPPLMAAGCDAMRPSGNIALLVGISAQRQGEGSQRLRFASSDARILGALLAREFEAGNVFTLLDAEATTAGVTNCLDKLVRFAQPGGKVVLFASARGFASNRTDDGYLITFDAAIDRLPNAQRQQTGNGISLRTLGLKLAAMRSREKYLLLDLCREPAESPVMDNLIHARIVERRFLDAASTRQIVLATSGSRRSLEANGNGVYAGSLNEVLASGHDLAGLFAQLRTIMRARSAGRQTPGKPDGASNDGWDRCVLCRTARLPGPMLAALFAPQQPLFGGPDPFAVDLSRAADAEAKGQEVFLRYGEGNHFSGDPLLQCESADPVLQRIRLCSPEYTEAAKQFGIAASLREKIPEEAQPGKDATLASLRERAAICRAQALLLQRPNKDAFGAQAEIDGLEKILFAESRNIRAIALLEQGKYPDAEVEFRLAIEKAPHWAYPRHNLALTLIEHGNYVEAELAYRTAIQLTPVGAKSPAGDGNPCFRAGRKVMVVERPYLYYNLGVLLQRLNRLGEAKQSFCLAALSFQKQQQAFRDRATAVDPALADLRAKSAEMNLADTENSLGALFAAQNKPSRAEERFGKALAHHEELTAAIFNLASLRARQDRKQGDTQAAIRRFREFLARPSCQAGDIPKECNAAKDALNKLEARP